MIEELRGVARPGLQEALGWVGFRVDDIYGAKIGTVADVWVKPSSGRPRWILIRGGRFGGHHRVIPFKEATAGDGHVWVPFEREAVRQAPAISPGESLSPDLDARLEAHYRAARSSVTAAVPVAPRQPLEPAPRARRIGPPPSTPAAVPLARARAERRRDPTRNPLDRLAVEVSDATVRLEGVGELDGEPVEIMLEGRFTGTILGRDGARSPGRRVTGNGRRQF